MLRFTIVCTIAIIAVVAPASAAATKQDCANLQADLLSISVEMRKLHSEVKTGTEHNWMGSLDIQERAALTRVQHARREMAKSVEEYIAATQAAAIAMTACAG